MSFPRNSHFILDKSNKKVFLVHWSSESVIIIEKRWMFSVMLPSKYSRHGIGCVLTITVILQILNTIINIKYYNLSI